MKTVIVISDTHGNKRFIEKMFPLFEENDYIIHLGDGNRDMSEVYRAFPNKTFVCQGNCDFSAPYSKDEWALQIEDCKILCCHGHKYGVKTGTNTYKKEAMERGFQVALYGHTHQASIEQDEDITLMNPGNAKLYSTNISYGYLVINGKKITATTVPLFL